MNRLDSFRFSTRCRMPFLFFVAVFLSAHLTYAQYASVSQTSSPVGFLDHSESYEVGTLFQSALPELNKDGYIFGYWTVNEVRVADIAGRAITQPSFLVEGTLNLVAHYFEENQDSDGDGLNDWYEYRNFGDLSQTLSDDPDNDGYSNGAELMMGQQSTVVDTVDDGGISSRDSSNFVFGDSSLNAVEVSSQPTGFVDGTLAYFEENASFQSEILNGERYGHTFSYWTVNDVRQVGLTGVASSDARVSVSGETVVVAHYYPTDEDSDADGIPDWFEYNQFGDLSQSQEDDSDGDSFSNGLENFLGQEAMIRDLVVDGGISSRDSSMFVFGTSILSEYSISSNPVGFIEEQVGYDHDGAIISTGNEYGERFGYRFAYWSINGVRQAGPTGSALSAVNRPLADGDKLVAHYLPEDEDADGDGIPDWYEMNQFGNLNQGPNDNPDGDAYLNWQEDQLGQESLVPDRVMDGGISSRDSSTLSYYVQANRAPVEITIDPDHFYIESENGDLVGRLNVVDYDDPSTTGSYTYEFVSGYGDADNELFAIEDDQVFTASSYEIGEFSIRVEVTDENGGRYAQTLTLHGLNNPQGDSDEDGLTFEAENSIGTNPDLFDTDGDGHSDGVEYAEGSDPLDSESVPNRPPTSISLSDHTIIENLSSGTTVGIFSAVDPDGDELTFSLKTEFRYHYSVFGPDGSLIAYHDGEAYRWAGDLNDTTLWSIDFSGEGEPQLITMRFEEGRNFGDIGFFSDIQLPQNYDHEFIIDENGHIRVNEDSGYQYYNVVGFDRESGAILTMEGDEQSINEEYSPDQFFFISLDQAQDFLGFVQGGSFDRENFIHEVENKSLGGQNGNNFEVPFKLDQGTQLISAKVFNYESDPATFIIRAAVSDSKGASFESSFTIHVLNEFEDLDADGVEDDYDLDDDGDGFSDAEEVAAGTNPRDANSMPNRPPHSLALSGMSILENQPRGSLVGKLSAVDPDRDELHFELVELQEAPESIAGWKATANEVENLGGSSTYHRVRFGEERLWDERDFPYTSNINSEPDNYSYQKTGNSTGRLSINQGNWVADLTFYQGNRDFIVSAEGNWTRSSDNTQQYGHISIDFREPIESPQNIDGWKGDLSEYGGSLNYTFAVGVFLGDVFIFEGYDPQLGRNVTNSEDYTYEKTGPFSAQIKRNDGSYVADLNFYAHGFNAQAIQAEGTWVDNDSTGASSGNIVVTLKPPAFAPANLLGYRAIISESFQNGDQPINLYRNGRFEEYGYDHLEVNYSEAGNVYKIVDYDYTKTDDSSAELSFANSNHVAKISFFRDGNGMEIVGTLHEDNSTGTRVGTIQGFLVKSMVPPESLAGWRATINQTEVTEDSSEWISSVNLNGMFTEENFQFDYHDYSSGNSIFSTEIEPYIYERTGGNTARLTMQDGKYVANLNFYLSGFNSESATAEGNWTDESSGESRSGFLNMTLEGPSGLFYVDSNDSVRTNQVFDFETDPKEFAILAMAMDSEGARAEGIFTIDLLNEVEDLDGDAVEDHYDLDDDGDGFSDEEELAFGSDPRDANSVVNRPPEDIIMEGGELLENEQAGVDVAQLIGIDADEGDVLTFTHLQSGDENNFPFVLSTTGLLTSTQILDYETHDLNYTFSVQVADERNATFTKQFTVYLRNVVEDMDGDGIEDPFDDDRDGDGFSNSDEVGEGTDPESAYSHSNRPIVTTSSARLETNGSILLRGKVLSDGQGKIQDHGFIISSSINLSRDPSAGTWVSASHGEKNDFHFNLEDNSFGSVFYFRAWAKNIAGNGISSIRKVVVSEEASTWWGIVEELDGGWMASSWFGTFRSYANDWIYHTQLGWIYAQDAPELSVWIWHESRGWLWTNESSWPYLWSDRGSDWVYLYPKKINGKAVFFDFSTQANID